jgi:hypothetical protein
MKHARPNLPAASVVLGAALTLGSVACGGGGDISGIYQSTQVTRDATGCGPGTSTTTPAFVRVQAGELLGASFFTVKACSGQEDSTCGANLASVITNGALATEIDGGFSGGVDAASGFDGRCALTRIEVKATRSGEVITIEGSRRTGELMVSSAECTTDLAKARAAELSCVGFERFVGNRVGDVPKADGLNLEF